MCAVVSFVARVVLGLSVMRNFIVFFELRDHQTPYWLTHTTARRALNRQHSVPAINARTAPMALCLQCLSRSGSHPAPRPRRGWQSIPPPHAIPPAAAQLATRYSSPAAMRASIALRPRPHVCALCFPRHAGQSLIGCLPLRPTTRPPGKTFCTTELIAAEWPRPRPCPRPRPRPRPPPRLPRPPLEPGPLSGNGLC